MNDDTMTPRLGVQVRTDYILTRTDGEPIPRDDALVLERAFVTRDALKECLGYLRARADTLPIDKSNSLEADRIDALIDEAWGVLQP